MRYGRVDVTQGKVASRKDADASAKLAGGEFAICSPGRVSRQTFPKISPKRFEEVFPQ